MTKTSSYGRGMVWAGALALLAACGGGGGSGGGALPPLGIFPPAPPPAAVTHRLEVGITGNGRVGSQPAGIDCTDRCSADFSAGTEVVLSATPAAGQVLGSWGGACNGNAGTCTVRMDAALGVTATFVAAPPVIGWGDASALSAGGASLPKTAIDAQGRALVVWRQIEGNPQVDRLWGSRYLPGGGWTAPQRLEANAGGVRDIRIAIDKPSGRAVVLWTQLSSVTGYDLWALPVDPAGGWGSPALLETGTGIVGNASVGIDANGNAVAVWSQIGPATRFSIYANRYTPGSGWGTAALIETNEVVGSVDGDPAVVVAGNRSRCGSVPTAAAPRSGPTAPTQAAPGPRPPNSYPTPAPATRSVPTTWRSTLPATRCSLGARPTCPAVATSGRAPCGSGASRRAHGRAAPRAWAHRSSPRRHC